jgi:hypothetical protein
MIFTVEIKGDPKRDAEVEVYLDDEALHLLIKRLELLKRNGGHTHFMTPGWAGNDLTEEKMVSSNDLINHLRITVVPVPK